MHYVALMQVKYLVKYLGSLVLCPCYALSLP